VRCAASKVNAAGVTLFGFADTGALEVATRSSVSRTQVHWKPCHAVVTFVDHVKRLHLNLTELATELFSA
jgi:hypothetical protein